MQKAQAFPAQPYVQVVVVLAAQVPFPRQLAALYWIPNEQV
jgi:hypothetical protein